LADRQFLRLWQDWLVGMLGGKERTLNIRIRSAALAARIQKQLEMPGCRSVEEVLLHLLETAEEQDRWRLESGRVIREKIRRGIDQLDRGEGIPEEQLDAYLAELNAGLSESARPRVEMIQSAEESPTELRVREKRRRAAVAQGTVSNSARYE
jgi:hypothetical protein